MLPTIHIVNTPNHHQEEVYKMATPTRFPGGLTNASPTAVLANLGQLDPTKFITYFDDFLTPVISTGIVSVAGEGGQVTVATTKQVGTTSASFKLSTTKQFFFKCRASLAAVAQTLAVGFSDNFASHAHGVCISITGTTLTLKIDGTTSTATISTTNDVMFELGLSYNSRDGVVVYLDDSPVLRASPTAFDTNLSLAGAYVSGTTATVDYVFAAVER